MKWNHQTRAVIVVGVFALALTGFSWRLIHVQVVQHHEFARHAAEHHLRKDIIHARRGSIRDARGEVLAENLPVRTVVADGSLIKNMPAVAEILSRNLVLPLEEVEGKIQAERRYVIIKREVSEEAVLKIREELILGEHRGVHFENDSIRLYPNGTMMCHILGFMNFERQGVLGVEKSMNDYLSGRDGYRWIERDRTGKELVPYRGLEKAAEDGLTVQLTIDMGLQSIVESEIDTAFANLNPRSITIILADPHTGEIRALANRPQFDPNRPGEANAESQKNRAVLDMVEPGSTFKIVVVSAALNEATVRPETLIFCENGNFSYGGRILKDSRPHGMLSVMDVLVKSSNIGSAKLAMQMGERRFYEYIRRFGFGERTGVELPGEIGGLVHPPSQWDKLSITRIPMGHAICATPLQLVMAMSAIANGGKLMMPRIVRRLTDSSGRTALDLGPAVIREVITPETAHVVQRALQGVTSEGGTARLARVEGYTVAGKTGTAQRVDPNGGYTPNKYVVSFLGYGPAENPALTCMVIIDDASTPQGSNYGGTVAAPIFSQVMGQAMKYLDLVPVLASATDTVIPRAKVVSSAGRKKP